MTCETCQDSGLEPIFEHVSFAAHTPAQKHVVVEPFDFNVADRQWEEDGSVHQLLEAFRLCACEAGQERATASRERQQQTGKKSGWQPTGVRA